MLKKFFNCLKIARKLSTSGAVDTINQIYSLPLPINIFFDLFSIGSNKQKLIIKKNLVKNFEQHSKVWVQPSLNLVSF